MTAARFALTPLFALLLAGFLRQTPALTAISPTQWGYLVAITASTGLVALAIYYFGLARVPASRSAILELTWPVSAVVIGYLFLGERLTVTQWIGAIALVLIVRQAAADSQELSKEPDREDSPHHETMLPGSSEAATTPKV